MIILYYMICRIYIRNIIHKNAWGYITTHCMRGRLLTTLVYFVGLHALQLSHFLTLSGIWYPCLQQKSRNNEENEKDYGVYIIMHVCISYTDI